MRKLYLDFTGVYADAAGADDIYLDLQEIRGTDMYCAPEAAQEIRRRIAPYGPQGIHFLDSGNYHYMSKLFAEMIAEDFTLLLFDHHTDMQKPMAEELLSCGGWAASLADSCFHLQQILVIGPPAAAMGEIDISCREKLMTVSEEQVLAGDWRKTVDGLRTDLPVYISIDRDVLDPAFAATNWDQGRLRPEQVRQILEKVLDRRRLIGTDLCGERSDGAFSTGEKEAARLRNEKADAEMAGIPVRGKDG